MAVRTRSVMRALSPLLVTAALLTTVATPADAARWAARDARGDVEKWSWSPEPEPCGTETVVRRPDDAEHDITRLVVDHRRKVLRVAVRFRDLRPTTRSWVALGLQTPGRLFDLDLEQRRPARAPRIWLGEMPEWGQPDVDDPDGCGLITIITTGVYCPGAAATFSPRRDTARVTVPRRCLGDPRWVRVSAQAGAWGRSVVTDRWVGPGGQPDDYRGAFGPRVRRG